jgi:hypothetical protein
MEMQTPKAESYVSRSRISGTSPPHFHSSLCARIVQCNRHKHIHKSAFEFPRGIFRLIAVNLVKAQNPSRKIKQPRFKPGLFVQLTLRSWLKVSRRQQSQLLAPPVLPEQSAPA